MMSELVQLYNYDI